jgi:hypothetical protein
MELTHMTTAETERIARSPHGSISPRGVAARRPGWLSPAERHTTLASRRDEEWQDNEGSEEGGEQTISEKFSRF